MKDRHGFLVLVNLVLQTDFNRQMTALDLPSYYEDPAEQQRRSRVVAEAKGVPRG